MSTNDDILRGLLGTYHVVPIVRSMSASADELRAVATVLEAKGLPIVEFPLTSPAGLEAISAVAASGTEVFVGAGTVLTTTEVDAVAAVGARFIVTPNLNPAVVSRARARGLAVIPGAFSPTEIVAALDAGATAVKVFPAGVLGPTYISALLASLRGLPLVPTGGVGLADASEYLQQGALAVGMGSSLVGDGSAEQIGERVKALRATMH